MIIVTLPTGLPGAHQDPEKASEASPSPSKEEKAAGSRHERPVRDGQGQVGGAEATAKWWWDVTFSRGNYSFRGGRQRNGDGDM